MYSLALGYSEIEVSKALEDLASVKAVTRFICLIAVAVVHHRHVQFNGFTFNIVCSAQCCSLKVGQTLIRKLLQIRRLDAGIQNASGAWIVVHNLQALNFNLERYFKAIQ